MIQKPLQDLGLQVPVSFDDPPEKIKHKNVPCIKRRRDHSFTRLNEKICKSSAKYFKAKVVTFALQLVKDQYAVNC